MTEEQAVTVTQADLLPCPFCGGEARYKPDHTTEQAHEVSCSHCCFSISEFHHENCVKLWNTRLAQPAPQIGDGWLEIASNPPPHNTQILLAHIDNLGRKIVEAEKFSTGERLPSGRSNYSQHAWATHWMPLPAFTPSEQAKDMS